MPMPDERAREEARGIDVTPPSAAFDQRSRATRRGLEGWLRSWSFWAVSVVLGVLIVCWANNLNGMFFGDPQPGIHRYGHRLFPVTRWILTGCLLGAVVMLISSWRALSETALSLAILWVFLGAVPIVGWTVLFGPPVTEYVHDIRRVEDRHVYLLRGVWGGSDMLYRLFDCDQAEFVCTDLTRQIIFTSSVAEPVIQIDGQRRAITILVDGTVQPEHPLPPPKTP